MGVFYNSICVPGERPEQVRVSAERWLAARGYQPSEEPPLFDLDGDSERSIFLVWNERWTVLFFSHWEEERRLIRELQNELAPLLYLWVYDSDVWGYDLLGQHGFLSSFSSNPKDYRSFAREAENEERPAADPVMVCAELGRPALDAPKLRAVQNQTALFKEDVCRELCRLFGLDPALASYDELETGAAANQLEGWQSSQRLYFHYDVARSNFDASADLHSVEIADAKQSGAQHSKQFKISPELLADMEQMRQRARFTLLLLKPVSLAAAGWRHARHAARRLKPQRPKISSPVTVRGSETAHTVHNSRHGVHVVLGGGVEPLPVSGKPASVCAFRSGDLVVSCTARRLRHLHEVIRPPARSQVRRDDRYTVGDLRARHLFFELAASRLNPSTEPRFLALHVVETFRALYVFLYRSNGDPCADAEARIRAVVESFQADDSNRRPQATR